MQEDLASELLDRIKDCSPSFFEKVVVELLVKISWRRKVMGADLGNKIGDTFGTTVNHANIISLLLPLFLILKVENGAFL